MPLSALDVLCHSVLVAKKHLHPDHSEDDIDFGTGGRSLGQ